MTATRRLAAIMAVDCGDHSRLTGKHGAGTRWAVREYTETAGPTNY
jgi:hypothetical protein